MPEEPAPSPKSDDVDDLFKEADDKAGDKSEPADDKIEEPKTEKSDDAEDLFKDIDDKKTTAVPAVDDEVARVRAEIEDLFGEPTDEAPTNVMRVWGDNTGKFQVVARLVTVGENSVRLLKETGKYTTVPFSRLSRADLAFVRQHSTSVIASNR